MGKATGMPVLVMDVEGTDGRERGEDQDFERKSALFSLATAEILLVNLWEHQVGLYQGANMGLLKTVFEVNLQLFQANKGKNTERTCLLFVIRDHIGTTPLANLSNTLTKDLENIWAGLSKPEGLEDCQISDYFDFEFTTLPHKLLQPEKFESEVLNLRKRFSDPSASNYVFKAKYARRIPADGLSMYTGGIWEQIMSNKDLDLPTQQELLAQYRCDEISQAAYEVFAAAIKTFRPPIEAGKVVDNLGEDMNMARGTALKSFDTSASRYVSHVYQKKRLDLLHKCNSALHSLFQGQLKNMHKRAVLQFERAVKEGIKGEGYDFAKVVNTSRQQVETEFKAGAEAISLTETDWTIDEASRQLQEDITAIADKARADEIKKMLYNIEKTIRNQLADPVSLALNRPSDDMWDRILKSFKDVLDRAESSYLVKAKSFNATDEENEQATTNLRRKAWVVLRRKIEEETADSVLLLKLRESFEDKFRYDSKGVPKVWKPEDDIDAYFTKARDETLQLLPIYSKIAPLEESLPEIQDDEELDFVASQTILTDGKMHQITNRFRREADAFFIEAKRSMVSSIAQVPPWLFVVLIVLGWNEFVTVLTNPLYLTLVIIFGAGGYVIYMLNLMGPAEQVFKTVLGEVLRIGKEQLANYLQPVEQEPRRRVAVDADTPADDIQLKEL